MLPDFWLVLPLLLPPSFCKRWRQERRVAAGVHTHSNLMPHGNWCAESLTCECSYCLIDFCSEAGPGSGILQKNRKTDDQRRIKTALTFGNNLILKPPTYFKYRQLQLQWNVEMKVKYC